VQKIYFYFAENKLDLTQTLARPVFQRSSPVNQYWQGFPLIITS
jgi:hypothetical protein